MLTDLPEQRWLNSGQGTTFDGLTNVRYACLSTHSRASANASCLQQGRRHTMPSKTRRTSLGCLNPRSHLWLMVNLGVRIRRISKLDIDFRPWRHPFHISKTAVFCAEWFALITEEMHYPYCNIKFQHKSSGCIWIYFIDKPRVAPEMHYIFLACNQSVHMCTVVVLAIKLFEQCIQMGGLEHLPIVIRLGLVQLGVLGWWTKQGKLETRYYPGHLLSDRDKLNPHWDYDMYRYIPT